MKVVICGGSGHVGAALIRHFQAWGSEIVVLSRSAAPIREVKVLEWDGQTLGKWASALDGADVVINLAGRSVNCRYNSRNLKEMMESRVLSTRAVGQAIGEANNPPKVWLQSSTATIYAHRFDAPNDEATGILGGTEPHAPSKWVASIKIALAWEAALAQAVTPQTRKVAMRSAMTMSIDQGSVFDVFQKLARRGLGGKLGSGKQYVSWIHEHDFTRAVQFVIEREDLDGPINFASPFPLPQAQFALQLRQALGVQVGLPATEWMVEVGTLAMQTESELVLKSRRVVPTRLLEAGFKFGFPRWSDACRDLVSRMPAR